MWLLYSVGSPARVIRKGVHQILKARMCESVKKISYVHGYTVTEDGKIKKTNESILLVHIQTEKHSRERIDQFMKTFFSAYYISTVTDGVI